MSYFEIYNERIYDLLTSTREAYAKKREVCGCFFHRCAGEDLSITKHLKSCWEKGCECEIISMIMESKEQINRSVVTMAGLLGQLTIAMGVEIKCGLERTESIISCIKNTFIGGMERYINFQIDMIMSELLDVQKSYQHIPSGSELGNKRFPSRNMNKRHAVPSKWFYCFIIISLSTGLPDVSAFSFNYSSKGTGLSSTIVDMPHDVYEYVKTPLNWWHANRYCEHHFAQLLHEMHSSELHSSELAQLQRLLQSQNLHGPVWLSQRDRAWQSPVRKQRRMHKFLILEFQNRTNTKYVKVNVKFPSISEITACAYVQWDNKTQEISTIFSYAVPTFINEFQLRGFIDEKGFVQFAIIVHGTHSPYLPVFRSDGQWHHFCVTWRKWNGSSEIYVDGKKKASAKGLSSFQDIYKEGIFIIGQDQDTLGGTFKEKESFSGNITDLNIWVKVLTEDQIERVRSCYSIDQDLIFGWSSHLLQIESTVQETMVQLMCPVPAEECSILEVGRKEQSTTSCLESLPFICHYPRDVYLQLKTMEKKSERSFINRVNVLTNASLVPENVFVDSVQDLNISAAVNVLGVIQKVMTERDIGVEPADLLLVIQLMKKVADTEIKDQENLQVLEDLSQQFVEVTGVLLEEQNTEAWSQINSIIRGPMTIVQTINQVATNLGQLLIEEKKKITIQHKSIEIEVRQVEFRREDTSSDVYMVLNNHTEKADQIEVPYEEVKQLARKGLCQWPFWFTKATVVNTWYGYGSLQRFMGSGHSDVIIQDYTISDGGYKYVSAQVGSAIISSTVLCDNQEISTSVRYHLWHQNQDVPDKLVQPICAFWNFSVSPETGGMWSSSGCSIISYNSESTSCFCNHTTNFAVLLQVYEVQRSSEEESALKTLTFIGCGVSFCALIITFILFLAVRVPKSERTTVHKNLIFALAAAEALLMFSELAKTNEVVCVTITAFLHLFFMAAFAWMLVEGLLLWSKVVAVNMSEDRRMKFYYATGWGLPVIIVGVTLATSFNKYVADNHCWLNVQADIIWAFVGPVLFVLTVNTFVLFRVVMVTVSSARRRSKMLTPSYSLEKQIGIQIWATAKPVLVLLPVLGLTWLCGVLVHFSIVWAYIFIVLNSFQGLYIFLVYAIYNSEVRNAIQQMKEKKKALSFTNCSHPINYLSSPRNTKSWETGKLTSSPPDSVVSTPTQKDFPPMKTTNTTRGNFVAKSPLNISSIMSTEKLAVELTAFKSSDSFWI
nr:adhesion G-protein coupled receptor D2 isoform X3 [Geotrypetes seraphini]XP_033818316.1 adhesion G-protein coupled receptor D2 isoform X3 [Geotrypetes seraphini]XP_033818317.1 adhesion G-protein coupled receptor D2 isoform X3 [Geotrypetes seraphini]